MKPKFRLHAHGSKVYDSGNPLKFPIVYWTCSVHFSTPSTEVLMNSGPCGKPSNAIAEAALLMRRMTGHAYR